MKAKIPVVLYLALKFVTVRKKSFFGVLTLSVAVGGVALGVAALIITLAVMSGFQTEIRSKIIGFNPHAIVFAPTTTAVSDKISKVKGVREVRPFVWGQAVVQSRRTVTGAVIKGADDSSTKDLRPGETKIGRDLARSLGVAAGDEIAVFTGGDFAVMPRVTKLKVAGFFETGMYEYDSNVALASLKTSRAALGLASAVVTGLGLFFDNPDDSLAVSRRIIAVVPSAQIRTWQQMNRSLFEALKLEKIMMFIILTLIVVVASFNIVSNLTLFVSQKAREVGILKSLGMTSAGVSSVFIIIGSLLGAAGTAAGSGAGLLACWALKKYDIIRLPADVYFISRLPVKVVASDVAWVVCVSLAVTVLATLWPSYKASRMNPSEIFRYG